MRNSEKNSALAPFAQAWVARFGCPVGLAPWGLIGKAIPPLIAAFGAAEVERRWGIYLGQVKGVYATPMRFAQTWADWVEPGLGVTRSASEQMAENLRAYEARATARLRG